MHFFQIFYLTNCWPCGIIEIRRPTFVDAATKTPLKIGYFRGVCDCFVVGIIQHFFSELALVHTWYSAPLHPVRSRTLSSRAYPTLVGLAISLASALLPSFVSWLYHLIDYLSRGFYDFSYRLATLILRLPCGIVKGFSVEFSFPYPHSACLVAKRGAITIVAPHLRPDVFVGFSLPFVSLL